MTALILDDESLPAKHLERMIQEYCFEIQNTTVFQSASAAINHLESDTYDIIFLDVEMPYGNAFDLLERVNDVNFEIIFVTAYSNYAVKAINFSAAYYILKPIDIDELITAVEKESAFHNPAWEGFKICPSINAPPTPLPTSTPTPDADQS